MSAASLDEAARDRPYAYSYARLVPHLTYGLYRISGLAGVCFSDFRRHGICKRGPRKGIIEMIIDEMLWFEVRRSERFLYESPKSHVKLQKDKSRGI